MNDFMYGHCLNPQKVFYTQNVFNERALNSGYPGPQS